jgi:hypothetical protein
MKLVMEKDGDRFICHKCGDVVSGYDGRFIYNFKKLTPKGEQLDKLTRKEEL